MSDVTKQVVVSKEVDDLVGLFVDIVLAAKNGNLNALAQVAKLIAMIGEVAALPNEIKNNQIDAAEAVALQMVRLVGGLMKLPPGN